MDVTISQVYGCLASEVYTIVTNGFYTSAKLKLPARMQQCREPPPAPRLLVPSYLSSSSKTSWRGFHPCPVAVQSQPCTGASFWKCFCGPLWATAGMDPLYGWGGADPQTVAGTQRIVSYHGEEMIGRGESFWSGFVARRVSCGPTPWLMCLWRVLPRVNHGLNVVLCMVPLWRGSDQEYY